MYVTVVIAVVAGAISPFALVIFVASPRAWRALQTLGAPAPTEAPAGYVGWPLWYHRTCLVHNRLFGWLYLAGLAVGVLAPSVHF